MRIDAAFVPAHAVHFVNRPHLVHSYGVVLLPGSSGMLTEVPMYTLATLEQSIWTIDLEASTFPPGTGTYASIQLYPYLHVGNGNVFM